MAYSIRGFMFLFRSKYLTVACETVQIGYPVVNVQLNTVPSKVDSQECAFFSKCYKTDTARSRPLVLPVSQ